MCLTPIKLKSGDVVPCSQCAECIGKHRSDWFVRLHNEALANRYVYFVTLTYNDENLKFANDVAVLHLPDVQKFFKIIRKAGAKFKYFGVGEYGERSYRPHYHLLIFSNTVSNEDINTFLDKWCFGNWHLGQLTGASINYCLKDMLKERTWFKDMPRQLQPRIFVSKGIGLCYVEKSVQWHKSDFLNRTYCVVDGHKRHLPRYYREKVFSRYQRSKQNALFKLDRAKKELISSFTSESDLVKLHREVRIYSQMVEQRRAQQLKVRHFNKSL